MKTYKLSSNYPKMFRRDKDPSGKYLDVPMYDRKLTNKKLRDCDLDGL